VAEVVRNMGHYSYILARFVRINQVQQFIESRLRRALLYVGTLRLLSCRAFHDDTGCEISRVSHGSVKESMSSAMAAVVITRMVHTRVLGRYVWGIFKVAEQAL